MVSHRGRTSVASPREAVTTEEGPTGEEPTEAGMTEEGPKEEGPTEAGMTEEGPIKEGQKKEGPTEKVPTEDGPTEKRPTEEPVTEEGQTEEGPTEEGPIEGGPTEERLTDGVQTDRVPKEEGPTEEGLTEEGLTEEEQTEERPTVMQSTEEGPTEGGPTEEGATEEGATAIGGKLDLSGLTDQEAEHVLQVVQRDMRLRKKEEERLSELRRCLVEEGERCVLLTRQRCFNLHCCIRCCSPFSSLLRPALTCRGCCYSVCRKCCCYSPREQGWICKVCQRGRLLESLDWFYSKVKKRFKWFGGAKVLKTLYTKQLVEPCPPETEVSSVSEEDLSVYDEDLLSCSDSSSFRPSSGRSEAETLSVALRVAEEAVDEAITKAEIHTSCQEQQREVLFLKEHRGELIQELSNTIVQKIISRRKTLAEMKVDSESDPECNTDLQHHHRRRPAACDRQTSEFRKCQPGRRRSHSASSLLDEDYPGLLDHRDPPGLLQELPGVLKKGGGSGVRVWRSEEVLDDADGSWGTVLQEIHKKMADSQGEVVMLESEEKKTPRSLLELFRRKPSSSRRTSVINVFSNQEEEEEKEEEEGEVEEEEEEENVEAEEGRVRRLRKRSGRKEEGVSSSSDLNLKREEELFLTIEPVISEHVTFEPVTSKTLTSEPLDLDGDVTEDIAILQPDNREREEEPDQERCSSFEEPRDRAKSGEEESNEEEDEEELTWRMGVDLNGGRGSEDEEEKETDEEMRLRLFRLVAQSRLAYFSSTDDELDKDEQSEEEWDREERKEEERDGEEGGLPYKLFQLEKEVRASQFSSTEDELDRVGMEGGTEEEEEEEEEEEDLAVRVCRLVSQVSTQFSSTEDELDGDEEKDTEEEKKEKEGEGGLPYKLCQLEKEVRASQFSSTEDELDRVGKEDGGIEEGIELWDRAAVRRESIGEIDVQMFDLRNNGEEREDEGMTEEVSEEEEEEEDRKDRTIEEEGQTSEKTHKRREASTKCGGEQQQDQETGLERREEVSLEEKCHRERKDSEEKKEEDEEELDRIISSMLMMTLEDMKVNTTQEAAEVGGAKNLRGGATEEEITRKEDVRKGLEEKKPVRESSAEEKAVKEERGEREKKDIEEGYEQTTGRSSDSTREQSGFSFQQENQKRSSAESLRSITTQVLRVLNATQELMQEVQDPQPPSPLRNPPTGSMTPNTDHKELEQQFSSLEENVYLTAGAVFGLEAELSDLEQGVRSSASNRELNFLEEKMAAAAAKVQQSHIQVSDISTRIAALKNAGLNVNAPPRLTKTRKTQRPVHKDRRIAETLCDALTNTKTPETHEDSRILKRYPFSSFKEEK